MEVYEYNQVKPILTDIQKITNILLKLPNSVTNASNDDLYLFYKNLCRDLFINFKFTKYQDFERYLNYEALKANKPLEDHMRTLITNYDTYADFVAKASHTLSYDKSIDYEKLHYQHLKAFYMICPTPARIMPEHCSSKSQYHSMGNNVQQNATSRNTYTLASHSSTNNYVHMLKSSDEQQPASIDEYPYTDTRSAAAFTARKNVSNDIYPRKFPINTENPYEGVEYVIDYENGKVKKVTEEIKNNGKNSMLVKDTWDFEKEMMPSELNRYHRLAADYKSKYFLQNQVILSIPICILNNEYLKGLLSLIKNRVNPICTMIKYAFNMNSDGANRIGCYDNNYINNSSSQFHKHRDAKGPATSNSTPQIVVSHPEDMIKNSTTIMNEILGMKIKEAQMGIIRMLYKAANAKKILRRAFEIYHKLSQVKSVIMAQDWFIYFRKDNDYSKKLIRIAKDYHYSNLIRKALVGFKQIISLSKKKAWDIQGYYIDMLMHKYLYGWIKFHCLKSHLKKSYTSIINKRRQRLKEKVVTAFESAYRVMKPAFHFVAKYSHYCQCRKCRNEKANKDIMPKSGRSKSPLASTRGIVHTQRSKSPRPNIANGVRNKKKVEARNTVKY